MKIKVKKGNIFTSNAQTLVNTVNTVGIMGAGIALEFRFRYPEMYRKYVNLCKSRSFDVGQLWLYKTEDRWVLNFPTKRDWKEDSKIEYLEIGLQKFLTTYHDKGITSIAFPILGSKNGRIPENEALAIMKKHLKKCDIPIEIYKYDPVAEDDLIRKIHNIFKNLSSDEIALNSGITKQTANKIYNAIRDENIRNINALLKIRGIGIKSIERITAILSRLENKISHHSSAPSITKKKRNSKLNLPDLFKQ